MSSTDAGAGGANAAPRTDETAPDSAPARSWSQLSTYRKCGKAYQLEKILRAPRRGAVWFSAGSAVHGSIEDYLNKHLEAKLAS